MRLHTEKAAYYEKEQLSILCFFRMYDVCTYPIYDSHKKCTGPCRLYGPAIAFCFLLRIVAFYIL